MSHEHFGPHDMSLQLCTKCTWHDVYISKQGAECSLLLRKPIRHDMSNAHCIGALVLREVCL